MFCVCVRKRDHVCNILNVKCSIYTINKKKCVCSSANTSTVSLYQQNQLIVLLIITG